MNSLNFSDGDSVTEFLHTITGHQYSFAVGASTCWGYIDMTEEEIEAGEDWSDFPAPYGKKPNIIQQQGYQLMPDGNHNGFFNWYCLERPAYQFHLSMEMCVVYFLKYWIRWNELGKPAWDTQHEPIS